MTKNCITKIGHSVYFLAIFHFLFFTRRIKFVRRDFNFILDNPLVQCLFCKNAMLPQNSKFIQDDAHYIILNKRNENQQGCHTNINHMVRPMISSEILSIVNFYSPSRVCSTRFEYYILLWSGSGSPWTKLHVLFKNYELIQDDAHLIILINQSKKQKDCYMRTNHMVSPTLLLSIYKRQVLKV